MFTLIWIFSISLFFIILMISYRSFELRFNKNIISNNTRQKTDNFVLKCFYKILDFIYSSKKKISDRIVLLRHKINEILHRIWRSVSTKVDQYFDKLRGRKNIGKKGAISLYWQKVGNRNELPVEEIGVTAPDVEDKVN